MPTDCGTGVLTDARVRITTGDEDERASLEGIAVVDGDLVIKNAPDADLSFLQCVREITGNLYVFDNDALVDTDGLYWLERVGGDVVIAENDALVDFTGLAQITEIEGETSSTLSEGAHSLFVLDNASLQRLSGLDSLLFVAGDLHIRDNPSLQDVDALAGLMLVGRTLAINHNPSLCASSVDAIGRTVSIGQSSGSATNANDEGC